ncbi:MAG: biopolymer transporter ExbD, partial [Phascolarctobacterium sp.]|nr:biopolymer transporter ExbD [Candidatus Phascolarctobacterium equi]
MLSPMIDMIFLLLVFFIISTMYMVEIKTIPIKMPTAAHTETVTQSTFVVTVKKDGTIYLDESPIALEMLCENAKGQKALDENFAVILR